MAEDIIEEAQDQPEQLTVDAVGELIKKSVAEAINGYDKRKSKEQEKALAKLREELKPEEPEEDEESEDQPEPKSKQKDPETLKLKRDLERMKADLEKEREERTKEASRREQAERFAAIDEELGKYKFIDGAQGDARDILRGKVKRDEDGNLVVNGSDGDETPMGMWFEDKYEKSTWWHAGKVSGGSGAKPTKPTQKGGIQLEDIGKEGTDNKAVDAEILAALQ